MLSTGSILLIRHGVTEMNEYLSTCPYGRRGFIDPGLFDTRLSSYGLAQASGQLRRRLAEEHAREPIDVLISSPLSRALATADLGLGDIQLSEYRVDPDVAERRYLSSDVGRLPDELATDFPRFASAVEYALPPSGAWWWEGSADDIARARAERVALQGGKDGELKGEALPVELNEHFLGRVGRFRDRLVDEAAAGGGGGGARIAVVAHWGVIMALTGKSLRNCDVVPCTPEQLMGPLTPPPD